MTYRSNFSKHLIGPETRSQAYTWTRLEQSSDLELKPTQATLLVYLSWDALCFQDSDSKEKLQMFNLLPIYSSKILCPNSPLPTDFTIFYL